MIQVSIPSMEKEVDDSGKTKKVRTRHFSVIGFLVLFFLRKSSGMKLRLRFIWTQALFFRLIISKTLSSGDAR